MLQTVWNELDYHVDVCRIKNIYLFILFIYLLQLGCHPVAVVILHVYKHEIVYY